MIRSEGKLVKDEAKRDAVEGIDNNAGEADKSVRSETTPPDIITQKREMQAALKQRLKKGDIWSVCVLCSLK